MNVAWVAACAVAGLVVGAWSNLVIATVPHRRAPRGPLVCPSCGEERRWSRRVPVVSWMAARGRCRRCGVRIGWAEPAVELVTAGLWAAAAWRFGVSPVTLAYLVFFTVLVQVSAIDLEHYRIPDRIVFPALAVSVPLVVVVSFVEGVPRAAMFAVAGALVEFGLLLVMHLVYPAGMGFGDVKLGLLLGLFVGWLDIYLVLVSLLVGSLAGVVFGLVATVTRGRRGAFAFGPALAFGAVVVVLFTSTFSSVV